MADRRRLGAALGAALILGGTAPGPALGVSPVDGGEIWISPVVINAGAGDQYDPHVSGDYVSYTASDGIHLYSFGTGTDFVLPTGGVPSVNQLSDVDGNLVAFAQLDTDAFHVNVRLYDIPSGKLGFATLVPSEQQSTPAVGGPTVALIDTAITPTGEILAVRLGDSITRLTTDARYDQAPDVDDSGGVIAWESCASTQDNCDIRVARWSGGAWAVTELTNDGDPDSNAATDGWIVAYDAVRAGERDIHWQPVEGGPEQTLELPGAQRNPNVSAGIIAFESTPVGGSRAELYLYRVATNQVFRVTTTPGGESLNDVDVLPDGSVRLVWSSEESGGSDRDVHGATIELPPVGPGYAFGGFVAPVDPMPTLNQLKAGAAVPVKFSLGGNHGLAVFAAGFPKSQAIACDATAPVDGVEQTVTAGGSNLTYDPVTGLYAYVWKTDRTWAGTCRQLVLVFADGSSARANFKFK